MSIVKSVLSVAIASGAAFALTSTAFATTGGASASASPAATLPATGGASPTPNGTPTPTVASAGPLTIALTCDTGSGGSGTFSVTANGKSSTLTVKCGSSASVANAAWKAGSTATIHQTASTAIGQLRAADVRVTLKASGERVVIRNFRAATAAASSPTTLAQTGGGLPSLPIGSGLLALLLLAGGGRLLSRRS